MNNDDLYIAILIGIIVGWVTTLALLVLAIRWTFQKDGDDYRFWQVRHRRAHDQRRDRRPDRA